MKTLFQCILSLFLAIVSVDSASAQLFIARAVLEEFYADDDIAADLQAAGYRKVSPSELPSEIADPMQGMVNYIDENFGDAAKRYYINESTGAVLLYGVEHSDEAVFLYAVNFFSGNENAVERIRELFTKNELNFDYESDGQYVYSDGDDAGGLVALLANGIVIFAYFEP